VRNISRGLDPASAENCQPREPEQSGTTPPLRRTLPARPRRDCGWICGQERNPATELEKYQRLSGKVGGDILRLRGCAQRAGQSNERAMEPSPPVSAASTRRTGSASAAPETRARPAGAPDGVRSSAIAGLPPCVPAKKIQADLARMQRRTERAPARRLPPARPRLAPGLGGGALCRRGGSRRHSSSATRSGQALGHFHFMDEPVRRAGQAAHSRRGAAHAANIAKLPE
jgi:hypothetical protein